MQRAGLPFEAEKIYPIVYDGVTSPTIPTSSSMAKTLLPIHEAQLISYLKVSGIRVGLLITFNVTLLKHGVRRKVFGY